MTNRHINLSHEEAAETDAASRYFLGEMSDEEMLAFEEHYFDCLLCAADVNDTAVFAANVPEALRSSSTGPASGSGFDFVRLARASALPLAAAAALLLGVVAVHQGTVVIPELRSALEPRAVSPTVLRELRSVIPTVEIEPGAATFVLIADLTSLRTYRTYVVELRDGAGEVVESIRAAQPTSGAFHLVLPTSRFPAGDYTAVLKGLPGEGSATEEIERYPFRVVTGHDAAGRGGG